MPEPWRSAWGTEDLSWRPLPCAVGPRQHHSGTGTSLCSHGAAPSRQSVRLDDKQNVPIDSQVFGFFFQEIENKSF